MYVHIMGLCVPYCASARSITQPTGILTLLTLFVPKRDFMLI